MNSFEKRLYALVVSVGVACWHIYIGLTFNELGPLSAGLKYVAYAATCVVIIGLAWVSADKPSGLVATYLAVTVLCGMMVASAWQSSASAGVAIYTALHVISLGPLAFWGFILLAVSSEQEESGI